MSGKKWYRFEKMRIMLPIQLQIRLQRRVREVEDKVSIIRTDTQRAHSLHQDMESVNSDNVIFVLNSSRAT